MVATEDTTPVRATIELDNAVIKQGQIGCRIPVLSLVSMLRVPRPDI